MRQIINKAVHLHVDSPQLETWRRCDVETFKTAGLYNKTLSLNYGHNSSLSLNLWKKKFLDLCGFCRNANTFGDLGNVTVAGRRPANTTDSRGDHQSVSETNTYLHGTETD
jgi:hypothetical protein